MIVSTSNANVVANTDRWRYIMKLVNRIRNSKRRSGQVAKERLSNLVSLDRVHVAPGRLKSIEREIAQVVRQQLGVDPERVEIQLTRQGRDVCLDARVSLRRSAA